MAEEVTPITITVESAVVEAALDRLARAARDLRPAMRDIGGLLEKETDDNFRAQGRPHWKPLSQATILNRLMGKDREGRSKGISSVLRKDGDLRASAKRKLEGGLAILQDTERFAAASAPTRTGIPSPSVPSWNTRRSISSGAWPVGGRKSASRPAPSFPWTGTATCHRKPSAACWPPFMTTWRNQFDSLRSGLFSSALPDVRAKAVLSRKTCL